MLSKDDCYYSRENIKKNRQIELLVFVEKRGQDKYSLILKFKDKSLNSYINNKSIKDIILNKSARDLIEIDIIKKQIIVELE